MCYRDCRQSLANPSEEMYHLHSLCWTGLIECFSGKRMKLDVTYLAVFGGNVVPLCTSDGTCSQGPQMRLERESSSTEQKPQIRGKTTIYCKTTLILSVCFKDEQSDHGVMELIQKGTLHVCNCASYLNNFQYNVHWMQYNRLCYNNTRMSLSLVRSFINSDLI